MNLQRQTDTAELEPLQVVLKSLNIFTKSRLQL